jgi:pimeloyl-ACP methyl ester carboxylesterase
VLPPDARDGDDVLVLLHGLFATAGVLRPLRAAIARQAPGAAPAMLTAAVSYPSGPGIAAVADRLAAALSALPAGVRLHLCGHSLGGIVCRYYALEAGDRRVIQTLSLATPFGGVPGLRLLGLPCAHDVHPRSPVLRRIVLPPRGSGVPHLSIVAGADALVRSPIAHALPGGDVRVMEGRGHSTLLFDPEVAALLVRRVLEQRSAGCGAAEAESGAVPGEIPVAAE